MNTIEQESQKWGRFATAFRTMKPEAQQLIAAELKARLPVSADVQKTKERLAALGIPEISIETGKSVNFDL